MQDPEEKQSETSTKDAMNLLMAKVAVGLVAFSVGIPWIALVLGVSVLIFRAISGL